MLLTISVPAGHDRGPQYAEQLLTNLHAACRRQHTIALLIDTAGGQVRTACRVPSDVGAVFAERLADAYPDATVLVHHETTHADSEQSREWRQQLWLTPDLHSLRTYPHFVDSATRILTDPLANVLSALRPRADGVRLSLELELMPTARWRTHAAQVQWRALSLVGARGWPALAGMGVALCRHRRRSIRLVANLALACAYLGSRRAPHTSSPKLTGPLFDARLTLIARGPRHSPTAALARLREARAALSPLAGDAGFRAVRIHAGRRPCRGRTFLLSPAEAATLWHPPTETVRVAELAHATYRELEPPSQLPTLKTHRDIALLGSTEFRGHGTVCGLLPEDRRRHLAIIGKTGMGKTTLMESLVAADIRAGRGVGLIDPHGDLAESLLHAVPRRRTNDVVYFDAADREFPVAFNPLHCPDPRDRALAASGIVSTFKRIYGESWGPRLEHILRHATLTLLEVPQASLLSLPRLLTDRAFRAHLLSYVSDPVVRAFWTHEFQTWKPQLQAEAVSPVLNKVGQFLAHPILRLVLAQPRAGLDLAEILDEGRIFIANLSKGRLGEDGSNLLGSLLVTSLQLAAMRRADRPEDDRRDFSLFVDEFQNFATDAFATILSEARKYRLNLTVATQYLEQVPEATLAAVFGNVGSLLCFQVGARDALPLAEQLGREVEPSDLTMLPQYTAYARLLVRGMPTRPFSLRTLPPPPLPHVDRAPVVRRTSRHRYAHPATLVEREIAALLPVA